jgi:hypothetical protein
LLRALNVFFTGHVEARDPIDPGRDFREPRRKVKSRISVEVELDYSVFGQLRKELREPLNEFAGGKEISFRKEWSVDGESIHAGSVGSELTLVKAEQLPAARRLLEVVRFRYVPNHVHPSEILLAEQDNIRRLLVSRLGKRKGASPASMIKSIASIAAEVMDPVREAMEEATGSVGEVELSTPADWKEIAWAFGLKLKGAQSEAFDALLHGSGVQSVLGYNILHAVDTFFGDAFGWQKGAIWALEEPESFLHAGLQAELARSFSSYATGKPLQILYSTHATAFMGLADAGLLASIDGEGRTELEQVERAELLRSAYASSIASFAHPLHAGPPKPILLVEGRGDRELLERAYLQSRVPNPYWIVCLEDIDEKLQGGDDLIRWLKYNRAAIASRPLTSPLVVLRDWETQPNLVDKINVTLTDHPSSRCVAWPEASANQELSRSFAGIERFLSTAFVEDLQNEIGLQLKLPANPQRVVWSYDVDSKALKEKKRELHRVLRERDSVDDLGPLVDALPWLSGQIADAPPAL